MEYLAPLISPPDGVSQHWPLLVQPHGQAALAEATTTLATNNESIRNIWRDTYVPATPEARITCELDTYHRELGGGPTSSRACNV